MNIKEIDRRKTYYLVLDIETANMAEDAICYDVGFAVCDKNGNIYEKYSYVVKDIFFEEKEVFGNFELMNSAYYAEKIPKYLDGIRKGTFVVRPLMYIRKVIHSLMKKYRITKVGAYNANFDRSGLDRTIRYITKSKVRYFFPYGTEIFCIWHMACQTILRQKTFLKFAVENGFVSEKGNLQTSAEVAYSYMTKQKDFVESHTGLADVEIEVAIFAKCMRQHKKMSMKINRSCWRLPTKELASLQA